jgi:hypothetical protein
MADQSGRHQLAPMILCLASLGLGMVGGCDKEAVTFRPPNAITDLAVSDATPNSVTLTWTAVGGDGLSSGAAAYDIRCSTASLDEAAWGAATRCPNPPSPQEACQQETYTMGGLSPDTVYCFAIRVVDESGNPSGMSNVAVALIACEDTLPPVAWVRDGLGDDVDWINSRTTLSAHWTSVPSADVYEYAVGLNPGTASVVGWTSAGRETSVTSGLDLRFGVKYFVSVRTMVGGCRSRSVSSDGVGIDTVEPRSRINPLADTTYAQSWHPAGGVIEISWSGCDYPAGIKSYDIQYRIGGGAWQNSYMGTTATSGYVWVTGEYVYAFRCRARDNAGNLEDYHYDGVSTKFAAGYGDNTPPPPPPPCQPPSPPPLARRLHCKLAMHLAPHGAYACKNLPAISGRDDLVRRVASPGTDLDVFVVVFAYDSLSAVEYGLWWPPEWGSAETNFCSPMTLGSIVNPGDGAILAWTTCQVSSESAPFKPVAWSWLQPSTKGEIEFVNVPGEEPGGFGAIDCRSEEWRGYEVVDSVFYAGVGVNPYEGPSPYYVSGSAPKPPARAVLGRR